MAVKNVTKENFEKEVVNSEKPVIIDFYADWCGPCKMLGPIYDKVSEDYKGKLDFKRIDTEEENDLAAHFQIQGIPALVVVNDKKEVGRIVGYMNEEKLKERIDELLKKVSD